MTGSDEAVQRTSPRRARAISGFLGRVLAGSAASFLALLVLLATLETAAWMLLEISWPQLAEIQSLLLVWLTFLTAAWGVHGGLHLGMEILETRLPAGLRRWVGHLVTALVSVFGLLCAIYGAGLARSVVNTLPATGWSASWQYLPAVIGGALIAILAPLARLAGQPPPARSEEGS